MKTFRQFLEEAVEASNSIKGLSPYKTMNQGTTDDKGNFRYIKRLFKKVDGKGGSPGQPYDAPKEDPKNPYVPAPKKITVWYQLKDIKTYFVMRKQVL